MVVEWLVVEDLLKKEGAKKQWPSNVGTDEVAVNVDIMATARKTAGSELGS